MRDLPTFLAIILLSNILIAPTIYYASDFRDEITLTSTIDDKFLSWTMSSQSGFHKTRVAIYDESNLTAPTNSAATVLTNNIDEILAILSAVGIEGLKLTKDDILNHELLTTDYDVFIMNNNIPRECITKNVKEFWLAGGGILSFNGALSYLWYEGLVFSGFDYDPFGIAWNYTFSDNQNVTSRHPAMTSYHINDSITQKAGFWATVSWDFLSESDIANEITPILTGFAKPNLITGFAVENSHRGGRIVHLPGDGLSISSDFESIIIDSIDWLRPRPAGRIVFDLSHRPQLGVDTWDVTYVTVSSPSYSFSNFRNLIVNHGYTFDKLYPSSNGNLTSERLSEYNILILIWPNINYTQSEINTIVDWVKAGGNLLVLGDRAGLSGDGYIYLNHLFDGFYMKLGTEDIMGNSTLTSVYQAATDSTRTLSVGDRNHLIISNSIWGDTESMWEEIHSTVVAGHDFGNGRVILSGDMNIFDNSFIGKTDNARFAANAINWLNAANADVLLFHNLNISDDHGYRSDVAIALNELGLPYQFHTTFDFMSLSLKTNDWDLVIVDAPLGGLEETHLDDLEAYSESGSCLIMSYSEVNQYPFHSIWAKLGLKNVQTLNQTLPLIIWETTHPIFNLPNNYDGTSFIPIPETESKSEVVTLSTDAKALAGVSLSPQNGSAVIVLGKNNQTLYNSFLIDYFIGDNDDSTYRDSIELWENEIAFMLRPKIDSPPDIVFTEAETNQSIIWNPKSHNPSLYMIYQNGTLIELNEWNGSRIEIKLDALAIGLYEYELIVYDLVGYHASDSVLVIVNPNVTFNIPEITLLISAGLIVAIIFLLGRFKQNKLN